ncbi:peptidyl-tRNA hydrolase [Dongia mobilis]|uniref:Peptidyl-tRNA hydrolase n=1 Tax=Dongia mobilis TaxID=578943 RepID=A0A4R6X2S3_9PROT|nr:aminoacyl-tRNA hydrolase [Dongia mobilis]TDQ86392.1 peptidyl-tRNA hydrolase [Dongia mobilis]
MRLIVGLGNPGPRYAGNRHNIGFMAVDEIVRRYSFGPVRERFHGGVAEGNIGGEKAICLCPATFMNESGRAVQAAMQFYKLAADDIIVIHDEIDLPLGKVKVKKGGGAGGHNGLRSIDAHIGPEYWRVRLGVGHPGVKQLVKNFVLMDFGKEERALVDEINQVCAENLPLLIAHEDNKFMTRVSLALNPPPPKDEALKTDRRPTGDDTEKN